MSTTACSVELEQGSVTGKTTCDLTNDISVGETVKLCGEDFLVVPPQDAGTISLGRPGKEADARCVAYREGETDKERILDELQLKRMRCQSLYCLAKIEEEERAIAMTLDRSMFILTHRNTQVLYAKMMYMRMASSKMKMRGNSSSTNGKAVAGLKNESSDALFENAKELARRAEVTKTSEDIGNAEKALSIAQSQEYIERERKKPKQPEKREKIDLLRDKLHKGELNPSDSPVIPQRIEADKPSTALVAARSLPGIKQDIKVLQGDVDSAGTKAYKVDGKEVIEGGDGDMKKEKVEPEKAEEPEGDLMGGSLAMPSKPPVSSTFKWWLENGIDHKYNREMQSMLNLRPSGKLTHGGEIKDNADGVKKIKEQGKEMNGAEEAQGQRAPVKGTKEGYAETNENCEEQRSKVTFLSSRQRYI